MIVGVLAGVAVVSVLWAYVFVVGRLASSIVSFGEPSGGAEESLVDVVVSTGVGLGLLVFVLFVLGAIGAFTTVGICATAVVLLAVVAAVRARQLGSLGAAFLETVGPLRACADVGWIASFAFALPTVATALLPATAPDSITYHLAHAVEWSRTGRITVDPYLEFPLFAFNFELLFAAFFSLHISQYVQFAAWATFAWSITGSYALARYLLYRIGVPRVFAILGGLCAAGLFASLPLALQYAEVAYIDIPAGFLLLSALSAAVLAMEKPYRYSAAIAVAGGCYVGIKLSLVAFVPLFAALIVIAGRRSKMAPYRIGLSVAALAAIASPWYAFNMLVAGDPLSPTLNILLGRSDPFWTPAEYHWLTNHMHVGPAAIAVSPITYFSSDCPSYSVLFLYVPAVAALVICLRKGAAARPQSIALYVAVTYAAVAIAIPSSMGTARYMLQLYAVYLASLVVATFAFARWAQDRIPVLRRSPAAGIVSILALAALAIPAPGSAYAFTTVRSAIDAVPEAHLDPERYLANQVLGYYEAEDLIRVLSAARSDGRVLAAGFENVSYYFRRDGIISVGLHRGPGRYLEFKNAIDSGRVAQYLHRFGAVAVMDFNANYAGRSVFGVGAAGLRREENLRKQLLAANFVDYSILSDNISEFVRADVLQAARAVGYTTTLTRVAGIRSKTVDMLSADSRAHGSALSLTPSVGAVYLLTWPAPTGRITSITIVSGYEYRLDHVDVESGGTLAMQVAKVYALGTAAVGWVDEVRDGKRTRIFTLPCPPAAGDIIGWKPVSIPLEEGKDVSLILGTSSGDQGGTADWIAFANPYLFGASLSAPGGAAHRGTPRVARHARSEAGA